MKLRFIQDKEAKLHIDNPLSDEELERVYSFYGALMKGKIKTPKCERYRLSKKITIYDGYVVQVFNAERGIAYEKYIDRDIVRISFKEIMEEAKVNLKEWGMVYIIIEHLLDGVIYQFGNYDLANVYKHGETRGYA